MKPARGFSTENRVPTFGLYGEARQDEDPGFLHLERISISSQPFDGVIKPHRHSELFQLLVLQRGSLSVVLEEVELNISEPTTISLPPGYIHGFIFNKDTEGYILTLALPLLLDSNADLLSAQLSSEPKVIPLTTREPATKQLYRLLELVSYELRYQNRDRILMCEHLVQSILIWLKRVSEEIQPENETSTGTDPLLSRFKRLIEDHYIEHLPVGEYSEMLGVSPSTLNRRCRTHLGESALQLIHFRLTQEIKRRLTFTQRNLEVISLELGFEDPAYFTRFFKRETGLSPSEYRSENNFGTQDR